MADPERPSSDADAAEIAEWMEKDFGRAVADGFENAGDADDLYPDSGYAVVVMDEFKPRDSDDFMNILGTFESADDVVLPAEKAGYTYYVHTADGDAYSRDGWPPDE